MESESVSWGDLDDTLEFFGWLSDRELIKEAQIRFSFHQHGVFRCTQNHDQQYCVAPLILDSVEAIVSLYKKTGELHEKNRYILTYYLSMSELNFIYTDQ